jgi:DNA-nicking Smr family endonuclease
VKVRDDDLRDWAIVAATVRPLPGRVVPQSLAPPSSRKATRPTPAPAFNSAVRDAPRAAISTIEPRRYRRMVLGREPIGASIDLHGLNHDQARAALIAFIGDAHERGVRGVLVITGKGTLGGGVLRRHAPEWLADPSIRPHVAGLSEAHRHHGGAGAIYVALKRRGRG